MMRKEEPRPRDHRGMGIGIGGAGKGDDAVNRDVMVAREGGIGVGEHVNGEESIAGVEGNAEKSSRAEPRIMMSPT